ncbi:MAG: helicase-related protein [Candidatus Bathyarchaeia archaeon]
MTTVPEEESNPLLRYDQIERRLYQESIARKATLRNTLVILPTALGKTVITALVAAHFLYNHRQARVLVMAPTRPLVMQHRESFMRILKIPEDEAVMLTGKTPNRYRENVWRGRSRLLFATPQVVKNDLIRGYVDMKEFSLLVFDECHRATKDYAYTYVAKKYMKSSPWPIILGATASPGAERERVEEVCRALFIEQIEYRSEEDVDVIPYIKPVQVEWRFIDLPEEYKSLGQMLRSLLDERLSWLRRMGYLNKTVNHTTRRDLLELGEVLRSKIQHSNDKGPIYSAIVAQSSALTLFHTIELLETQGIDTLTSFLMKLESEDAKRSYRTIINSPQYLEFRRLLEDCKGTPHPKQGKLIEEIERQLGKNPSSRIIVFTQYRDTATGLVEILRGRFKVGVERFVGQAVKEGDIGLSQDEQSRILKDLDSGKIKILVATCIAEEGLDMPSVDLVIFYEPVPSEIRHIQRRGRTGRKSAGRVVILAAKDTFDIAYLYSSKRRVERMRRIIRSLNRELKPLIRLGPKPEPQPLTYEEILELEERIGPHPEIVSGPAGEEEGRRFISEVEGASRKLMVTIIEAGSEGCSIESLMEEYTQQGFKPNVISAAIDRLEDSGQILRLGWDRVASVTATPVRKRVQGKSEGEVFNILIEKVYPGRAVAWVNDRWRARILPEDFEGPINLLKKDSRFKAYGSLYRLDGILCFRVRGIADSTPDREN